MEKLLNDASRMRWTNYMKNAQNDIKMLFAIRYSSSMFDKHYFSRFCFNKVQSERKCGSFFLFCDTICWQDSFEIERVKRGMEIFIFKYLNF